MRSTLLKYALFVITLFILFVGSIDAQNEPLSLPKSLDWSPDGTKIATGHRDGYVAIWDASTGELLENYQLTSPSTPDRSLQTMRRVRWSPDGSYLAIAEMRDVPFSIIVILDAATGARITHMETQGLFSDIAWSPDGQFLASVVSSVSQIALADALVIWNPMTGEEIRRINPPELQGLYSLAWSPDGQQIVVGGTIDNLITIWDVATGNKLQTLVGHTQQTDSVDWSAVTGQIVSDSSADKTVNIWNSATGQLLHSISVEGFPEEVQWHPYNPIIAVAARDENIRLLDATTGQLTQSIPLSDFTGDEPIAWSPYGGRLAYARIIPASDQDMTRSSNLNGNGIEMIVPIASIEQLNAIATACQAEAFVPEQTRPLLNADRVNSLTTDALPDFVAQVESLPEGAIPAACRADLLAVADALR